MAKTAEDFVKALREMADLYEAHPELPVPSSYSLMLNVFVYDGIEKNAKAQLGIIARAIAPAEKVSSSDWFTIRRKFGEEMIQLDFSAARNSVCTSRVVSVEHVPEKVIPEQVIPARDIEILEWECPKLLEDDAIEVL